jgi:hypothetical protein
MHIAFISLEKAFDTINRSKLWEIIDKRVYPKHLINILINMYETKIKIELGRLLQEIVTNKGVRQGCSLSPLLFIIYIDDVLRELKKIYISRDQTE